MIKEAMSSPAEELLCQYRHLLWQNRLRENECIDTKHRLLFIESLVKSLADWSKRGTRKDTGQKMYAVVHQTYLTPRAALDTHEILDNLKTISKGNKPMPQSTYWRLLSVAISALNQKLIMADVKDNDIREEIKVTADRFLQKYQEALWKKALYEQISISVMNKTQQKYEQIICFAEQLISSLKAQGNKGTGVKMQEIIRRTYMETTSPASIDVVMEELKISRRTYYNLKSKALEIIGKMLICLEKHAGLREVRDGHSVNNTHFTNPIPMKEVV
ncbi:MAG: hypothetical protein FWE05_05980 [Defluviitaleaceae bacterium]|nr:hypothetical protein [Defluviitaleaceae bacterium]